MQLPAENDTQNEGVADTATIDKTAQNTESHEKRAKYLIYDGHATRKPTFL